MAEEGLPLDQAFHNLLVLDDPVPAAAERNEEQNSEPGSESDSEEEEQPEDAREGELIPQPEEEPPETREDFLQYYCRLELDPETANLELILSNGNRKVTREGDSQLHDANPLPKRFSPLYQVLCTKGLSDRSYWEVEWSRSAGVDIAVTYEDIIRKGERDVARLGRNDKSWALRCSPSGYIFRHNKGKIKLPDSPPSRIGVYLDYKAGTLSFYSVSDTLTLLHRVKTTFTQPLYPGFWLQGYKSSVELHDLRK